MAAGGCWFQLKDLLGPGIGKLSLAKLVLHVLQLLFFLLNLLLLGSHFVAEICGGAGHSLRAQLDLPVERGGFALHQRDRVALLLEAGSPIGFQLGALLFLLGLGFGILGCDRRGLC